MRAYFEDYKLYTLQIEVNQVCHQNCIYCYARESRGEEMKTDFVKSILDDAAEIKVRKIEWLGGDCLLHTSWKELMAYAKYDHNLINNIWTSGNQLNKNSVAEKCVELTSDGGFISVHLDSVNPDRYKELTKGNIRFLEDTLRGLQKLIDFGKPSSEILNCMALTGLVVGQDFENTIHYFHEKFDIPVTFISYKPTSDDPRLLISPQQIKEAERIKTDWIKQSSLERWPRVLLSLSSVVVRKMIKIISKINVSSSQALS